MRPIRIAQLSIGALLALVAAALLLVGGALTWWHVAERDDGWFESDRESFETETFALTSPNVDLTLGDERADIGPLDDVGTVRLRVDGSSSRPIFVGIAAADDVDSYLTNIAHEEIEGDDETEVVPGELRPVAPATLDFWVASASGTGQQTLEWDVERGDWVAVVMNADGSAGLDVAASVGLKTELLLVIGAALLVLALLTGGGGTVLLVLSMRDHPLPAASAEESPAMLGTSAIRVRGHQDPSLSRGLWLVKWFLAIPHLIVLALLWPVFVVTTVFAGVAILATGRYPRSLFDLNVGILRWTWRVTFYAFVLGTDRYPPFSLAHDEDYPAQLEVARPEQLSRGLVLVKWWLLALPHYLIVAIFGGGLTGWLWAGSEGSRPLLGGGLIGLLALVGGVVLLFRGRFPTSLFDFIMGMERWTYRVLAYAALLRDEYPPFRLDPGGDDPPSVGAPGSSLSPRGGGQLAEA